MLKKILLSLMICAVASLAIFQPAHAQMDNALNLVWHEASDAVFSRGYVILAGVDIDQDGKGEMLTYDGDGGKHIIYLFEASGDNNYDIIWQYQFSDGMTGISGVTPGIMVTDIDNDGFQEIIVIVDSEAPGTTNGFDAGHIFEWDGTDNGLPNFPTETFDPPRDALDQIRLTFNSTALDLDNDGNVELVLLYWGGNGKLLSIIQLTSSDLSGGVTMTVEFDENFVDTDETHFLAKNLGGFGITDIDLDGLNEVIMFDVNTGFVRVYEGTGINTYAFVKEWQPNPIGWVTDAHVTSVRSMIPEADFDNDGVKELYLSDTKGNSWIITPNGDVATMFDDVNWTKLHDWKISNLFLEDGNIHGGIIGDVDGDNKPDIYLAGNTFGSILDIEYNGGNVKFGGNYSYFITAVDANDDIDGGHFARPSNIALSDMDNDGYLEVVVVVPWRGGNPIDNDNLLGLYVFELETPISVDEDQTGQLPRSFTLFQNYPNPFNPKTVIDYVLPVRSDVKLTIYNLRGEEVALLINGTVPAGNHRVSWDASGFASGIYFYRLQADDFVQTKKMLLLK